MYRVIESEPGLYTVGTGTLGVDWNPVADHGRRDVAQADAERRNSPHVYALLDKARQQIDELIARLDRLEDAMPDGLSQADIAYLASSSPWE